MRILSWTKILVSNKIRENWVKIPMALAIICAYDLWFIWFFLLQKVFYIKQRIFKSSRDIQWRVCTKSNKIQILFLSSIRTEIKSE